MSVKLCLPQVGQGIMCSSTKSFISCWEKAVSYTHLDVYKRQGVVSAEVNGKKEVTNITIKPEAVDPEDVEMLQDLIISAVNEALRQAEEAMDGKMNALTSGLGLGGFGF